jgi:hypothetical protein
MKKLLPGRICMILQEQDRREVFAQEVFLSTILLHSSFLAGKLLWKEVSTRNPSKTFRNGNFFQRKFLAEKLAGRSIVADQVV